MDVQSYLFLNYIIQVPKVQMQTQHIHAPADSDGSRTRLCAQPGDVIPVF